MQFIIANTFTQSLRKLESYEQDAAKATAFEVQADPKGPGLSFHRVERARDKNMWTCRVNRDIRIVVHMTGGRFTLCYVAHHGPAYEWAQRHKLQANAATGALHFVDVSVRTEEVVERVYTTELAERPLFPHLADTYLLALGVPPEWVPWVKNATETTFIENLELLPAEAAEALIRLYDGEAVPVPERAVASAVDGSGIGNRRDAAAPDVDATETAPPRATETDTADPADEATEAPSAPHTTPGETTADATAPIATAPALPLAAAAERAAAEAPLPAPLDAPDTARRFKVIESPADLAVALDAPWDEWTVFLHPAQRRVVELDASGPVKVIGAAGTGKTIVALHRAAALARGHVGEPTTGGVLLTTYTRALAAHIGRLLDKLFADGGAKPDSALTPSQALERAARGRITVQHIHSVATALHFQRFGRPAKVLRTWEVATRLAEARADTLGDACPFDDRFVAAEFAAVIEPAGIRDFATYRSVARVGRGTPLGARERKAVWTVVERMLQQLEGRGETTWHLLCHQVADALADEPSPPPFRHVVADESQDFTVAELRLVRALAPPARNDLFLCADDGQRIYGAAAAWVHADIEVRGRAHTLAINYRTTDAIRRFADTIRPPSPDEDDRASYSLRSGPEPELFAEEDGGESEGMHLVQWVTGRLEAGLEPEDIGVFARTDNVLKRATTALEKAGYDHHRLTRDQGPRDDHVSVATMHTAKGLEFRAVAVIGLSNNALPMRGILESHVDDGDRETFVEAERNLLYVAATRAREHLLVTWRGDPSPFLQPWLDGERGRPRAPKRALEAADAEATDAVVAAPEVAAPEAADAEAAHVVDAGEAEVDTRVDAGFADARVGDTELGGTDTDPHDASGVGDPGDAAGASPRRPAAPTPDDPGRAAGVAPRRPRDRAGADGSAPGAPGDRAPAEAASGAGRIDPAPEPHPDPPRHRAPYRLSPSRIARYFALDCQRYLRFDATADPVFAAADRVPDRSPVRSTLHQAILDSGFRWEARVLAGPLADRVHVAPGEGELTERTWPPDALADVLARAEPGTYVYQPTLRAPASFYAAYELDPELVRMSDARPDLIAIDALDDGRRRLRIVDMKRGRSLRSSYRVQLLVYARLLAHLVDTDDYLVDDRVGAIWLGEADAPTPCALDPLHGHLERFLVDEVQDLLTRERAQVEWHVNFRCEWCRFFDHCRDEMVRTDDLSRVPRLTHQGKRHLRAAGVHTVAELDLLLDDRDLADDVLGTCASLAGEQVRLGNQSEALHTGEVVIHGASSPGLPRRTRHELSLYLTVQREALGHSVFLAGFRVAAGPSVPAVLLDRLGLHDGSRVFVAPTPADAEHVPRQFLLELYALLVRLDAYNLDRAWGERIALQTYVFSAAESALLSDVLFAALDDPALAGPAMALLLHFQSPDLILVDDHPGDQVPYPIVVVLNALGRLLAMPIDVAYTLPESLAALVDPAALEAGFLRDDAWHFPLSPALRAEPVFELWHGGLAGPAVDARVAELTERGQRHLRMVETLLEGVRSAAYDHLYTWAPRFSLPPTHPITDPLLSKLAFFAVYESVLRCLGTRELRMIARAAVPWVPGVLELEATDVPGEFLVLGRDPVVVDASTFPAWLLARDDGDGRLAALRYPDFGHRKTFWGGGKPDPHLAVVHIDTVETDAEGAAISVCIGFDRKLSGALPNPGESWLLMPRFTDFTTDRLVGFLTERDGRAPGLFRTLLGAPERIPAHHGLGDDALRADALATVEARGFTASQRAAFETLCDSRVLALWGPPGTGKTHFLANAIAALAQAHAARERPFRVLVTAFTHAAIENVLRALANAVRDQPAPPWLAKAKDWRGAARPDAVALIPDKRIARTLADQPCAAVGATVWSLLKEPDLAEPGFDLVVVDEASQVRVPEAAIPAHLVAPGGRIVFAGDHEQLPPIVQGSYPEPEPGEVVLHRSVFEAVRQVADGRFERQLLENFRMNEALTALSAQLLYGARYCCGNATVAGRRLPFAAEGDASAFVAHCLDPDHPIVLVELDGLTPGKDSPVEAQLVAELALALRGGLATDAGGDVYPDDGAFFEHGLFVVSPHHTQIHHIQRALAAGRTWTARPFVDTVDKMQGQEADAVIVSYGVTDPEYALREAEFIYSRNRLNVAITRARSKLVVFLSRGLLQPSPQVLENEVAAVGLSYMQGLSARLRRHGVTRFFTLADGVTADVSCLRVGAPEPTDAH